jgi:hypothetical protein
MQQAYEQGRADGANLDYDQGRADGHADGRREGFQCGFEEGRVVGRREDGGGRYDQGRADGYADGMRKGREGAERRVELARRESKQKGYDEGYEIGHDNGYNEGAEEIFQDVCTSERLNFNTHELVSFVETQLGPMVTEEGKYAPTVKEALDTPDFEPCSHCANNDNLTVKFVCDQKEPSITIEGFFCNSCRTKLHKAMDPRCKCGALLFIGPLGEVSEKCKECHKSDRKARDHSRPPKNARQENHRRGRQPRSGGEPSGNASPEQPGKRRNRCSHRGGRNKRAAEH